MYVLVISHYIIIIIRFQDRAVVCGGEAENGTIHHACFGVQLEANETDEDSGEGGAEWQRLPNLLTARSGKYEKKREYSTYLLGLCYRGLFLLAFTTYCAKAHLRDAFASAKGHAPSMCLFSTRSRLGRVRRRALGAGREGGAQRHHRLRRDPV